MPAEAPNVVINSSAWTSRVNWTAGIGTLVTALISVAVAFGVPITPEQQVALVTASGVISNLLVIVFRSFLPGATPTAPQMRKVLAEKKENA